MNEASQLAERIRKTLIALYPEDPREMRSAIFHAIGGGCFSSVTWNDSSDFASRDVRDWLRSRCAIDVMQTLLKSLQEEAKRRIDLLTPLLESLLDEAREVATD